MCACAHRPTRISIQLQSIRPNWLFGVWTKHFKFIGPETNRNCLFEIHHFFFRRRPHFVRRNESVRLKKKNENINFESATMAFLLEEEKSLVFHFNCSQRTKKAKKKKINNNRKSTRCNRVSIDTFTLVLCRFAFEQFLLFFVCALSFTVSSGSTTAAAAAAYFRYCTVEEGRICIGLLNQLLKSEKMRNKATMVFVVIFE